MPLYDYECKECEYKMSDIYQSIKEDSLIECPSCKSHSLERIIYGGIYASVKDVKTIGQLADKNWKNLGHYKQSEINSIKKDQSKKSIFDEVGQASRHEINRMTSEQKTKYIMTGEK